MLLINLKKYYLLRVEVENILNIISRLSVLEYLLRIEGFDASNRVALASSDDHISLAKKAIVKAGPNHQSLQLKFYFLS